ncbi:MAG: DUF4831 family protein [Bacteroidales bacterium]|nr:DUF4831 family protein [Bacteroidales bacterium]
MKKRTAILLIALACACTYAKAQSEPASVSYALPKSVLSFDVKAQKTSFHAGPYAKYASKYLGFEAREADETSYSIVSVSVKSRNEADQGSRYSAVITPAGRRDYFSLGTQGLIVREGGPSTGTNVWRFPAPKNGAFSVEGLPANLTRETGTLYRQGRASVQQSAVVEKSEEQKAREVADKIFAIREQKYKILVGDTDATYSGEAMKATIDELNRIEAECLELFQGSSESAEVQAVFEIIPEKDVLLYVAFRVSDEEGLVQADNIAGKPYIVELKPEEIPAPQKAEQPATAKKKKGKDAEPQLLHYRIPAICTLRLGDGQNTLLQARVPVYQFGIDETMPIATTK